MDGWMDGWMDIWMDIWTSGYLDIWIKNMVLSGLPGYMFFCGDVI